MDLNLLAMCLGLGYVLLVSPFYKYADKFVRSLVWINLALGIINGLIYFIGKC